jgi:phage shock protein A
MIFGQATEKLEGLKRELKDIQTLKQQAAHVSRSQKEVERLQHEIASIEEELKATGSTRTADDVQEELDEISAKMQVYLLSVITLLLIRRDADGRMKEKSKRY